MKISRYFGVLAVVLAAWILAGCAEEKPDPNVVKAMEQQRGRGGPGDRNTKTTEKDLGPAGAGKTAEGSGESPH